MVRYLVVRHRVEDYERWKRAFDEMAEERRKYGLKGGEICRDVNDPHELTVVLECEDVERAKGIFHSKEAKQAMKEAGIVGKPDFFFLEELTRVSAPEVEMAEASESWCDCC